MTPGYSGHCLCGGVRVSVRRAAGPLVLCHCSQCRRATGAPFQAVFPVALEAFALDDPGGLVRTYRASPGKARCFCSRCGAPLYSRRDGAAEVRVRAGLFNSLAGLTPAAHIFHADAAGWYEGRDRLPRYRGLEPGRAGTDVNTEEAR